MKTAQELLTEYNATHMNSITEATKLKWLRQIEMKVMSEVMYAHDDMDKDGTINDALVYERGDYTQHVQDKALDISENPYLYVDGDALVMTAYDMAHGEREADTMDMETALQIPEPYQDVYEYWLDARIAYAQGNTKQYNASSAMFNEAYLAYQKYVNRTHRGNHVRRRLLRHEVL